MKSIDLKKIFILFLIITTILLLSYFVIFGRALRQSENHIGIFLALPKVIFNSGVTRLDDDTYLSKNPTNFTKSMEQQGYTYIESMGSGQFFEKDGKKYAGIGHMYSSLLMVFTFKMYANE
ncbi:hypothetical protein L6270_05050 [Candidatus Parcubacteria bacterium]|nr:hypothetical protein [Patescibacteria group bacterium]MBU4309329.1 hypothetical protein [Patescibacteria group bacterium]MBU4432306.1 hypothetical protein [Patescibacteria group bacterium]MBU4577690.1 hypothetical protein [Patescibacteria group bacterium]MCG2697376.1 hypothetical protein [Candidatus Parcubacteria bacterium]